LKRGVAAQYSGTVMRNAHLGCAAMLFAIGVASVAGASPFRVGEPVPRLRLPSVADGRPLSLADFRGEKLMLHVWASW
jgi:hypothetical protein